MRKYVLASPKAVGCRRKSNRDPIGLERLQLNGRWFSKARDSGSTIKPYDQLTSVRPPATRKGTRNPTLPSRPPRAGPKIKPSPNAAPISPKFADRFSGGLTSAMYAVAAAKLA